MKMREVAYRLYERTIARSLDKANLPGHIGVVLDGNRRWAKATGISTASGHQAGADKILEFLGWCIEFRIPVVTLYLLSTENLNRDKEELTALIDIISHTLARIANEKPAGKAIRLNPVGSFSLLPDTLSNTIENLTDDQPQGDVDLVVNVAVGYGGREEIVDAVRSLLVDADEDGRDIADIVETLSVDHISDRLYTRGQPDPDLVIRTSGEQRLSGFLMWQSAYSEFYFCEALWPAFRRVDFMRALRDFSERQRRFGA